MIKRTGSGVRLTIYVTLDKLFKFFPLNNSEGKAFSCVLLFVTPWTIQSMEFSRPKYWSG